jgi:hypothetical protein
MNVEFETEEVIPAPEEKRFAKLNPFRRSEQPQKVESDQSLQRLLTD